jgi:hypothetical protein
MCLGVCTSRAELASVRTNELQVWFIAEHLVDVPLVAD